MATTLTGLTWDDPRGLGPLRAATASFAASTGGNFDVTWNVQSLRGFESTPLAERMSRYDLIVMDHPHVAAAARHRLLEPVGELEDQYVGQARESYQFGGFQWAVPIDAACQVAASRRGFAFAAPSLWDSVLQHKRQGLRVVLPLAGVHALMAMLTLIASWGETLDGAFDWQASRAAPASALLLADLCRGESRRGLDWSPIDAHQALANGECDYVPLAFGYAYWSAQGIRFASPPAWRDGTPPRSVLGGTGLAVSATSQNIDASIAFARYVGSRRVQREAFSGNGGQPAHRDAWNVLGADERSFYGATRDVQERAFIRPQRDDWNDLQTMSGELIEGWLRSESADPAELLGNLNDCWNRVPAARAVLS